MRKKVKKLWVDALMSGRYVQCKSQLCSRDNRYCCLGVLTELYIEQMKKNRKKPKVVKTLGYSGSPHYRESSGDFYSCVVPSVVQKWAGLTSGQTSWAMIMNDQHKLDFLSIANCIEYTF